MSQAKRITPGAEITFYQVRSDAEIKATFYGPEAETDALSKALEITDASRSHAEVYRYTQKSLVVAPKT